MGLTFLFLLRTGIPWTIGAVFKEQRIMYFVFFVGLVAFLCRPISALAQTGTSVIRGVVRDAKQAVVPGASVIIVNQDTRKYGATRRVPITLERCRVDLTRFPSRSQGSKSGPQSSNFK